MEGLIDRGIFFFNSGRYFEAHEVWEDLWREEQGEGRIFYQALVQAAVGMHHATRNNKSGSRAVLLRALSKLDRLPEIVEGIEVGTLRRDLRQVLDKLEVGDIVPVRIVR